MVAIQLLMLAATVAMTVLVWSSDAGTLERVLWPVLTVASLVGLVSLRFQRQRVDADIGGLSITAGARRSRVGWDDITGVQPAPRDWRLQLRDGTEVALPAAFPLRLLEDWRHTSSRWTSAGCDQDAENPG